MRDPELFVGIDVSKAKHDIAIVKEQKTLVIPPFVIPDSRTGYEKLCSKLERLKQQYHTQTFHIGMESTADYWKNLYYFLKHQGSEFQVSVINPVQTKHFVTSYLRRAKTDKTSARDIALFMLERRPQASVDKPLLFEIIRDIDMQIHHLTKQKVMLRNRLHIELVKVAPELEKQFRNLNSERILQILIAFPSAEAIARASIDQLQQIRYGKRGSVMSVAFIQKLKALCQNSVGYKTGSGSGVVVQSLTRQILNLKQEIARLQDQVLTVYARSHQKNSLLATIPGITPLTAIIMEAYMGNINRFPTAKQITAYFGMNPIIMLSGKSIKGASPLQKKGNPRFRNLLFMATLTAVRLENNPVARFFQRKIDEGKPKLVAIGAAMRKLLTTMYFVLKYQRPFDPKQIPESLSKNKVSKKITIS